MVGGLVSSFALELLVYPAIYYLWKRKELNTNTELPLLPKKLKVSKYERINFDKLLFIKEKRMKTINSIVVGLILLKQLFVKYDGKTTKKSWKK